MFSAICAAFLVQPYSRTRRVGWKIAPLPPAVEPWTCFSPAGPNGPPSLLARFHYIQAQSTRNEVLSAPTMRHGVQEGPWPESKFKYSGKTCTSNIENVRSPLWSPGVTGRKTPSYVSHRKYEFVPTYTHRVIG